MLYNYLYIHSFTIVTFFFFERSIGFITTMKNINLRSIRWESIKAVFLSIARSEKISRADISAETDLSLMTVGKVADALMDIQVIEQCKESKNSAGRRAGLLSIKKSIYSVILDLTSKNFSCCIMDLRLNPVDQMPYSYVDSMSLRDNLDRFLQNVSSFLSREMESNDCIGIGLAVPGTYIPQTNRTNCRDFPELDTLDLTETVSRYFPDTPILIESAYSAAAISHISQISGYREKVIFYWCVSENGIHGAIIPNGKILHGAHYSAGNFGQVIVPAGVTLSSLVKRTNPMTDNATALVRSIHNVIRLADPDAVILECTMYENGADFCDLVRNMLIEDFKLLPESLPEILVVNDGAHHAFRGLTINLRKNWLRDRLFTGN